MEKRGYRITISLISVLVLVLILILIKFGENSLDYLISNSFVSLSGNSITGFFIFLGHYSKMIMILIAIVVAIFLYLQKRKIQSLMFVLTLGAGYLLENILKLVIQRGRPAVQIIQENGYSFPSGHSIFSIILFSFIIYFYKDKIKNKALRIIFVFLNIFLIILVGFSRIYLNVHWLTDVIGGYALGFLIFNLGVLFLENKPKKNSKKFIN